MGIKKVTVEISPYSHGIVLAFDCMDFTDLILYV